MFTVYLKKANKTIRTLFLDISAFVFLAFFVWAVLGFYWNLVNIPEIYELKNTHGKLIRQGSREIQKKKV